jgi:uncharacterized protein (DUF433 family)
MDTDKLIQERYGELYVGPSRVLVWVIAASHERGETPEQIHENFPTISLAEVMGTIIYYLEHKEELDARFAEDERRFDEQMAANRAAHAEFYAAMKARIEAARKQRRERGEQVGEVAEA